MQIEIKVPSMGESVSEATIGQILKPSGSLVAQDEELLELETDKVNQVLYAPKKGLLKLTVSPGDTVQVGQVIGSVDTAAEGAAPLPPASKVEAPVKITPAPSGPSVRVTPEEFAGEILSGAVSKPEVAAPAPKKEVQGRKKMSKLRRVIAQKLVEAKNTTAMLTTFNEVDMSAILEVRQKEKDAFEKKFGVRLGFMSFFVKAAVSALKAFPDVNSSIEGDEIVTPSSYDIGVAVSTDKGLFVPVLRACDKLNFGAIEKGIRDFAQKAKDGTISVDDLRGGSFTITNGGVFGSLLSTPILNPPQSAILGMHTIVKRPVVIDEKIEIRPMMYLALSYDHRIIDGREAVSFLVHIKQNLEEPTRLLLDF